MAQKREQIEPQAGDKRYIRRDENGRFTANQVEESRSLAADNNQKAKMNVPKGQGDKGDHRSKK